MRGRRRFGLTRRHLVARLISQHQEIQRLRRHIEALEAMGRAAGRK